MIFCFPQHAEHNLIQGHVNVATETVSVAKRQDKELLIDPELKRVQLLLDFWRTLTTPFKNTIFYMFESILIICCQIPWTYSQSV